MRRIDVRHGLVAGLIGGVALGALIIGREVAEPPGVAGPGPLLQIVATVYPLEEWAKAVGGDRVEVTNPVPAGFEPHDFELAPRDVQTILTADLVVYVGRGFQPALDAALARAGPEGPAVFELSVDEPLVAGGDPHVWLSPVRAAREVKRLAAVMGRLRPPAAEEFAQNAHAYAARLEALHAAYQEGLAACERRVFIASHAAFGYLAREYGLHQISAAGLSPEQEPTPRELAALAEEARELGVQYVFSERLVSPRLAETLAGEIGAGVLVLDPLESLTPEQVRAGEDYFTVMRQNLANLRIALACR